MKIFKRNAECVSIMYLNGERLLDWRCPICGYGVAEEYICCPYCRQKLKFEEKKVNPKDYQIHLTSNKKYWEN